MMRRIGAIVLALGVATITSLYLYGASNRSFATREQFERQRRQVFERRGIQARPRFVTLRNPAIETHFLELGNGPAVVVIHGGGGNSSGWSPILWPLSQRFHLFVPDRPGHELTDAFDYSGIDFRRHVVNFAESFLDSQGLDRVSFVGNSRGGLFSLAFALEHQERVDKLVLIGAPAGIDMDVPLPMRLMATPGINTWFHTVRSAFRGDESPVMPSFLVAQPHLIPHDELVLGDLASRLPGVQQSFQRMLEEVLTLRGFNPTYYIRDELDQVTAPTLFIQGSKDGFAPPQSGEEVVRQIPNARIEIIPEVGHLPWTEEPDLTARLISEFLRP